MCGNILPCFAPPDDRGDRTNQLYWLERLHTLCISLLNQAESKVGSSIQSTNVSKPEPTHATFSINKF